MLRPAYGEPTLHGIPKSKYKANSSVCRALGSPSSGKTVHIDYTMTAVNTFQKHLVPELKQGEKFRFVYTSGGAVPYLASSSLFFLGSWRTLRVCLPNRTPISLNCRLTSYLARSRQRPPSSRKAKRGHMGKLRRKTLDRMRREAHAWESDRQLLYFPTRAWSCNA